MASKLAPRNEYIENLYKFYEGDIHKIMNKYDLDGDDWIYLTELKAWYCGWD